MDDHERFLGPEGGIPPTKRSKLDETSGRPVGTKVGLGRKGRTVGACIELGGTWGQDGTGRSVVMGLSESYQWQMIFT